MIKKIVVILVALLPLMLIKTVDAACNFDADSALHAGLTVTVPLVVPNITVGGDSPNGTVVYRQNYNPSFASGSNVRVSCDINGSFEVDKTITNTPLPRSSWAGTPFPNQTYQTGVAGLSAAVTYAYYNYTNGLPFPNVVNACGNVAAHDACDIPGQQFTFNITIIKTGPVTAGTINGANLPCLEQTLGVPGNRVSIVKACFSGVVNVVSKTCITPDVHVDLGKHDVADFSGSGSATDWVDASIKLSDCPVFYGLSQDSGSWSDNGTLIEGTMKQNTLYYSFTSNTPLIDSAKGIFAIDSSLPGAANGIGIQIAAGTPASALPFDFGQSNIQTMNRTQGPEISIPLVARYVQTSSSVRQMKPGIADGKLTFNINYY